MAATTVAELNFEAGSYPIPSDPIELEASLRAADEALLRMPYFELRFGERGRRFTRSDSAWLATLPALEPADATRQVEWLARLLSARGMPSWTMQRHLELLHTALCAARPERSGAYAILLEASRGLARKRNALITDAEVARLAAALEAALEAGQRGRLPEAAWLVASAVADERSGVERAVTSLLPWLCDRARFSRRFAAGVEQTLAKARACVGASTSA